MNTRMFFAFVVLCIFGVVGVWGWQTLFHETLHPPPPSLYVPDEYQLMFFDEFETQGLDAARWRHRYREGHEYGAGIASHSSVYQPGDGLLHLVTRYEDRQFLTGMIRSVPQFQYGYFEARIRFQTLQGHHGAFGYSQKRMDNSLVIQGEAVQRSTLWSFLGMGE